MLKTVHLGVCVVSYRKFFAGSNGQTLNAAGDNMHDLDLFEAGNHVVTMIGGAGTGLFALNGQGTTAIGGTGDDQFFETFNSRTGTAHDHIMGGGGKNTLTISVGSNQLTAAVKSELARLEDYLTGDTSQHFVSDILHLDMAGVRCVQLRLDGRIVPLDSVAPSTSNPGMTTTSSLPPAQTDGPATMVTTPGSGLVINLTWDTSVASAPAAFQTAMIAATRYIETQFTNAVTLNLAVGWGEVGGQAIRSLGETTQGLYSYSYAQVRNALAAHANTTLAQASLAALPTLSPMYGASNTIANPLGSVFLDRAEAKSLGLLTDVSGTAPLDAKIGFMSSAAFTFDPTNGVAANSYDFNAVALHELTEAMGRTMLSGPKFSGCNKAYNLLDLFHYSAPGVRDYGPTALGGFLSADGQTALAQLNTYSSGDRGDWSSAMGNDAFLAFSTTGTVLAVSQADLQVMNLFGWTRAGVSGEAVAAVTDGLANARVALGLLAGASLEQVSQTGGVVGDGYTYTLGGTDAARFTLATANNTATLAVGSQTLAGVAGGRAYAVTLDATDTTSGVIAPAMAEDIIVANAGGDTVNLAALLGGANTAVASFVYGSADGDTLNATGMTGPVTFIGGLGADVMTGGTGVNDYLYGSTGDSTVATADIIANFHAADLIDLTGLGTALAVSGALAGSVIAAGSIGWYASGGTTQVYVNASASAEALAAADMKLVLTGTVVLSAGNFLHA